MLGHQVIATQLVLHDKSPTQTLRANQIWPRAPWSLERHMSIQQQSITTTRRPNTADAENRSEERHNSSGVLNLRGVWCKQNSQWAEAAKWLAELTGTWRIGPRWAAALFAHIATITFDQSVWRGHRNCTCSHDLGTESKHVREHSQRSLTSVPKSTMQPIWQGHHQPQTCYLNRCFSAHEYVIKTTLTSELRTKWSWEPLTSGVRHPQLQRSSEGHTAGRQNELLHLISVQRRGQKKGDACRTAIAFLTWISVRSRSKTLVSAKACWWPCLTAHMRRNTDATRLRSNPNKWWTSQRQEDHASARKYGCECRATQEVNLEPRTALQRKSPKMARN